MTTADSQSKELQYEASEWDNETWANKRIPSREAVIEIVNYAAKEIEPIIYTFVHRLATPLTTPGATTDASSDFSHYYDVLTKDDKFKKLIEKIHEEMHKDFEKGYEILM